MEWILTNHPAQSCFSSLGTLVGDNYAPSKNCLDVLNEIHVKLLNEDKFLRPFRRAINFSQALQKDFIPLLVGVKEPEVISGIIKILVNVLVPVECLIPEDVAAQTEVGRVTVFELSTFLARSKGIFREQRVTRAILDFIKSIAKFDTKVKLDESECEDINNCLLLIRNILHIPESRHVHCSFQNQIVWNLFAQNIDKVLIQLMTCEQRSRWGVAIVQLIAVLYKDQHAGVLQKLLHVGFEGSVSTSTDDNESNTMPDQQSDSTPVITSSEPTSDSSDYGGKLVGEHEGSSGVPHVAQRMVIASCTTDNGSPTVKMLTFEEQSTEHRKGTSGRSSGRGGKCSMEVESVQTTPVIAATVLNKWGSESEATESTPTSNSTTMVNGIQDSSESSPPKAESGHESSSQRVKISDGCLQNRDSAQEYSDCGYVSHVETFEAEANNSTSSNEEENLPSKRVKPHIHKTRYAAKQQSPQEKKETRRKKLMKRSKSTIMKMKAIANHVPTDEDITDVLKEFTVDFMLKGYDPLVGVLYNELMTSTTGVVLDVSHFFWLITYFLKFAGQLELDLDHIREALSYRIVSYLVYEGVRICENADYFLRKNSPELKMTLRRQHLAITAIREFILSVQAYDKFTYLKPEDKGPLQSLQGEMNSSNDLKCLFVLLLRQYNQEIHSKQYLEDLIVTNHIFLSFLENIGGIGNLVPHRLSIADLIKQFASADVIAQYGRILGDFQSNGEYINDCILTMMHHIGGELNQVASLCQPNILKTFAQILESDFELCDDWSDLIEYVIHRFVNIPLHCPMVGSSPVLPVVNNSSAEDSGWPREECENLYWYFYLSSSNSDLIANIIRLYEENGVVKTRIGVIDRLMKQGVINEEMYKVLLDAETQHNNTCEVPKKPPKASNQADDEIDSLREALVDVGLGTQLLWIQRVLLETCYVKLHLENHPSVQINSSVQPFEPIPYYFTTFKQAVPVVPWNADLAQALRKKAFQCLLRNLGFSLSDESSVFIRIPSFWTPVILLKVAKKLGPLDTTQLKFDIQKFSGFDSDTTANVLNETLNSSSEQHFLMSRAKHYSSLIKCTPLPTLSGSWLDVVKKSKKRPTAPNSDMPGNWMDLIKQSKMRPATPKNTEEIGKANVDVDDVECASVDSVGESVTSDLGCMYVSDEETHLQA